MTKQNKQRLVELFNKYSAERWPSVPAHARAVPKWSEKNANELTKCVIDFIQLSGYHAERVSPEGRVIDNRKTFTDVVGRKRTVGTVKRIPTSMRKGTSDIHSVLHGGKFVAIEIKFNKDTQSKAQKKYEEDIKKIGAEYWIVKTFDDFIAKYDDYMLKNS